MTSEAPVCQRVGGLGLAVTRNEQTANRRPQSMTQASLPTASAEVRTEIWAIAWPRPQHLSHPTVAIITTLGTEGARFRTNQTKQRLPVGTTLELCFALPGVNAEIVCGAVVTRVTARDGTSVAFTLLDCHDQAQLRAWVTDPRWTTKHEGQERGSSVGVDRR